MKSENNQKVSVEIASMILRSFQSKRKSKLGDNDIVVRAIDTALQCLYERAIEDYKQKGLDKYIDLDKLLD